MGYSWSQQDSLITINEIDEMSQILIVEDTISSLMLLRDLLSSSDYSIRLAQDGEMALTSLASGLPDLILLDIQMPGIDGFEVSRRIKSNPVTANIPIIFLSALQDSDSLLHGFKSGAIDYISKPYLAEEVLARVHTHIELQKLRNSLENEVKLRTKELEDEVCERKRIEYELRENQTRLQNLSAHLESVREKERSRISRELHDELGQSFTVMKMNLTRMKGLPEFNNSTINENLNLLSSLIEQAADSARTLSENLRPGVLDLLGLNAALQSHIQKFMQRTGINTEFLTNREDFKVDDQIATALFRIVQEAMTNCAKHSKAKNIVIKLLGRDSDIILTIQDDGIGFVSSPPSINGFGMIGMEERARSLGGKLVVESDPAEGTRIEAYIPLNMENING